MRNIPACILRLGIRMGRIRGRTGIRPRILMWWAGSFWWRRRGIFQLLAFGPKLFGFVGHSSARAERPHDSRRDAGSTGLASLIGASDDSFLASTIQRELYCGQISRILAAGGG